MIPRRLLLAAPVAALPIAARAAWPERPLRLVVPFPPGGVADALARPLAQLLGPRLGQSLVIDNRGGAAGAIGAAFVAKAAPDGLTLLFGTSNELTMTPPLQAGLPYDPAGGFAPVTPVAAFPNVLVVRPGLAANSLAELVALARRQPQPLSYASSGIGSTNHLTGVIFSQLADLRLTHVPYPGGGPALNDVVAGHVDMLFATLPSAMGLIQGGQLRALAVTGDARSPALPAVPSAPEAGMPGLIVSTWNGVLAPAGTPDVVIARLHAEILAVLAMPELRDRYAAAGAEVTTSAPAAFAQRIRDDLGRWGDLVRRAGIRPE
ncbi:MAG TPA: tripartite tricarboxylate transporter substrate binding protein [Roseomonas sp.]|jgi:tripartite-type tricarboxylate transporter receptor subunit TctC